MIDNTSQHCSSRRALTPVVVPKRKGSGFSLMELLVVMAIIAILTAAMVKVADYVRTEAQGKNTKATMQLLVSALQTYEGFRAGRGDAEVFPLEPLGRSFGEVEAALAASGSDPGTHDDSGSLIWDDWSDLSIDQQNKRLTARASIEVLYWYLEDLPVSRAVLAKLSGTATANDDGDSVTVEDVTKPLIEVNDAWGRPIRYERQGAGNFPALRSAGPDGLFDNSDDIVSSDL